MYYNQLSFGEKQMILVPLIFAAYAVYVFEINYKPEGLFVSAFKTTPIVIVALGLFVVYFLPEYRTTQATIFCIAYAVTFLMILCLKGRQYAREYARKQTIQPEPQN